MLSDLEFDKSSTTTTTKQSLPRKSETPVKIGKNQPVNKPLIQWGEARSPHCFRPIALAGVQARSKREKPAIPESGP